MSAALKLQHYQLDVWVKSPESNALCLRKGDTPSLRLHQHSSCDLQKEAWLHTIMRRC